MRYDVCPRASDLEEFHVCIELLKQEAQQHTKLLNAHNGYIRANRDFQNKLMGGLATVGIMSSISAIVSLFMKFG